MLTDCVVTLVGSALATRPDAPRRLQRFRICGPRSDEPCGRCPTGPRGGLQCHWAPSRRHCMPLSTTLMRHAVSTPPFGPFTSSMRTVTRSMLSELAEACARARRLRPERASPTRGCSRAPAAGVRPAEAAVFARARMPGAGDAFCASLDRARAARCARPACWSTAWQQLPLRPAQRPDLLAAECVEHVRCRDDADELAVIDDRQRADQPGAHQVGRVLQGHVRPGSDRARRHQILHRASATQIATRPAAQVPLGDDPTISSPSCTTRCRMSRRRASTPHSPSPSDRDDAALHDVLYLHDARTLHGAAPVAA